MSNKILISFFRLLALIKFHNFINHEHFDTICVKIDKLQASIETQNYFHNFLKLSSILGLITFSDQR